ncbi:MAG TPA: SDR family oxidoreductase [Actinophytocola sp.]|uniref:SDR family oxidoreductase n=1 Tax=Actinophytocola sp. TaxID=1872138 RepID=UPI002DBEBFAF|nr:SDR family oxidoreductase [Actinophytocola sp.]HEU5470405.1 SDR family oxidoreductase [Actinophytocola sp.]
MASVRGGQAGIGDPGLDDLCLAAPAAVRVDGMSTTKIALVTGANKGIGKEIARQLGRLGMTVLVAARDEGRGRAAAEELVAAGIDARPVPLDVTDPESVATAAKLVEREHGRMDLLVNNAGIVADGDREGAATVETFQRTYATNVVGVLTVTRAMLPLLRKASEPGVVNLSSELGSIATLSDPNGQWAGVRLYAYNSSKAALNMVTVMLANELRADGITVNAVSPGYCATDLNGHQGYRTPEQGAADAVRVATRPDRATGGFHGEHGPLPW